MNIRDAILAAAAHIEANPGEYAYRSTSTPSHPGCGTPGCALGWIQSFYGQRIAKAGAGVFSATDGVLGVGEGTFYVRMSALARAWMGSAAICASGLRLYADKYHPAAPVLYPNWQAIASKPLTPFYAVLRRCKPCGGAVILHWHIHSPSSPIDYPRTMEVDVGDLAATWHSESEVRRWLAAELDREFERQVTPVAMNVDAVVEAWKKERSGK